MDEINDLTKFQKKVSEKGKLIRTVSYDLEALQSNTNALGAQVMLIDSEGKSQFFLQLTREGELEDEYDIAAIAEEDLKKLEKALADMKKASQIDVYVNADHIQNIYATDDYFTIGYFVLDAALTWFIGFDEMSDELDYFEDASSIEKLLTSAQEKIEEIKTAQ
ncbi:MAG: hypothetical protein OEV42_15060 [Deltaproteobacteria bacterium]|nr:hypothetical protein [Deltaproteobacteria bacterium]